MKTELFYFSGTGNTLYTTKKIAEKLNCNLKIVPIQKIVDKKYKVSSDCKRIGFLFPLYYLSLPEIVMRFIDNLEIPKNVYIFTVVTRGFPPMGGALKHLKSLLKAKGRQLDFGTYLDMPSNDLILFGTFKNSKNKKMLSKSNDSLLGIVSKISNSEKHISFEPFSFLRKVRHETFLKRLKESDGHYWVKENCNGCGICQKVCPVENITMKNGKPIWKCLEICQECEGCINYCPKKSIEYGNKSQKWSRYYHPEIKVKEIINQDISVLE